MQCQNQQSHNNNKHQYKPYFFSNNQYCVFLNYIEGHPINLKQKFVFGYIRVFDENKMYYKQLISTVHLNNGVEWDSNFYHNLIKQFERFEIKKKNDVDDQTLDFIVKINSDQKQNQIVLYVNLSEDFGSNFQKEFWKEFEHYNNSKNEQILQNEQINQKCILNKQKKLDGIKKYYQQSQKQTNALMGRLSAILAEKVNKLREFEEDYNIELFEDKLRKIQEEQEQRVMSTYQEDIEMAGTLFQPSQNFR